MRLRAPLLAACILLVAAGPALGVTRYTVRWGDTLTAIAHNHGVGVWRLARRNHIRVHGILREGTVLVSPAATGMPVGSRPTPCVPETHSPGSPRGSARRSPPWHGSTTGRRTPRW